MLFTQGPLALTTFSTKGTCTTLNRRLSIRLGGTPVPVLLVQGTGKRPQLLVTRRQPLQDAVSMKPMTTTTCGHDAPPAVTLTRLACRALLRQRVGADAAFIVHVPHSFQYSSSTNFHTPHRCRDVVYSQGSRDACCCCRCDVICSLSVAHRVSFKCDCRDRLRPRVTATQTPPL
jgi:hypothetical protein